MTCPTCDSDNIMETGRFDLQLVEPDECRHDFECFNCGECFQIVYAAVATKLVGIRDV
jgi:ssDNA-binding Zn-finger/Zn-ribbon topoisomerase 1